MGGKISKFLTPKQVKDLVNKGTTVRQIAAKYGVSTTSIYNYLSWHGVKLRSTQETVKEGAQENRIYTIRTERGMTQRELGAIVGLSQQTVANHERRVRKVSSTMKQKYAEALDTTVEKLFID